MAKQIVQLNGLNAAQCAALALCKGKAELTVGEHDLYFEVAVRGQIVKAAPEEYIPTVDIPHKRALAFLLQFAGLAGEAALKGLVAAMSRAVDADADCDLAIIEQAEAMVAQAVGQLPKKVRSGKTSVGPGGLCITRID